MKTLLSGVTAIILMIIYFQSTGQTVVISDDQSYTTGVTSAVLDIKSTERGLIIPRMNMIQRNEIVSPATGLLIFQTDEIPGFYFNAGTPEQPIWKLIRIVENEDVTKWNTAFNWGNHAEEGYLKTESDPAFENSPSSDITTDDITNWNIAYNWGNHALAGYAPLVHEHEFLFRGTGLTGNNYNGGSSATWAIDFAGTGNAGTVSRSDHIHNGMVSGSGATGKLTFWNGTSTVGSNNYLHWDNSNGLLGIGSNSPFYPLTVLTSYMCGIYSESSDSEGYGMIGYTSSLTGTTFGIAGESLSSEGIGVYGLASSLTGSAYGIVGESRAPLGYGIFGHAAAVTGINYGVLGESKSSEGFGVYGHASSGSGINYGVVGRTDSPAGYGLYGLASETTGVNFGTVGESRSSLGYGVLGFASSPTGVNYGVLGESKSSEGFAVYGFASSTSGANYGVLGRSDSPAGYGIYGLAKAMAGINYGVVGESKSVEGYGVFGHATSVNGVNYGCVGRSESSEGYGLAGVNTATTGITVGVLGLVNSTDGFSGYFSGGRFYIGAYLGIGTDLPTAQLHTTGTVCLANYTNGFLKTDLNGNLSTVSSSGLFDAGNGLSWSGSTLTSVWTKSGNNVYNNNPGNVGIGITNPQTKLHVSGTVDVFGPWTELTAGVVYNATTDGFVVAGAVVAVGAADTNGLLTGYTDSGSNPVTVRGLASVRRIGTGTQSHQQSFTMPVRKGDYWKVVWNLIEGSAGYTIYWLPLGSGNN